MKTSSSHLMRDAFAGVALASVSMFVAACSSSGSGAPGGGKDAASDGPVLPANCINSPADLIADFSVDNGLAPVDGRMGGFYTYGDPSETSGTPLAVLIPPEGSTASIDATVGNACSSPLGSLHVQATGFKIWGAAMGTNFVPLMGSTKGTYDATKYKGVSFWAKATAPLTGVQVSFPDVWTDAAANPTPINAAYDPCVYVAGANNNCSPYLVKFGEGRTNGDGGASGDTGMDAAALQFPAYVNFQIDTAWKRFDVLFADTLQDKDNLGQGSPSLMLDVAHLTSMAIQVNAIHNPDSTVTANDFSLWIDDVNFLAK
jgi:hypothetical protein